MYTNVMTADKSKETIEKVLGSLSNYLKRSLGPYGSTTLLEGRELNHHMTKDGYTILKALRYNEPMANVILEIIRDAAFELVSEVGDGSTSTIISANALYENLKPVIEKSRVRPKDIVDIVNKCIREISKELDGMVRFIEADDFDTVEKIARISLNNNEEGGAFVRKIYEEVGTEGFINIKLGSKTETTYTKVEGFQLDAGYLDNTLANNESSECVLTKPMILMFDEFIGDELTIDIITNVLNEINAEMKEKGKNNATYNSLLVIAPGYGEIAKQRMLYINTIYRNSGITKNFNFIAYNIATEHAVNVYSDLSIMLGAEIIKNSMGQHFLFLDPEVRPKAQNYENVPLKDLAKKVDDSDRLDPEVFAGTAETVTSTSKVTTFFGTHEDEKELERMKNQLKTELKDLQDRGVTDLSQIYSLKKRLAILNKALITIVVGGNTEQERLSNKDLYDDAIAACRSALDNGYVIGCNLSIVIAISNILNSFIGQEKDKKTELMIEIYEAMKNAFITVYSCVLQGGIVDEAERENIIYESIEGGQVYDLVQESYTDESVINSVMTEKLILQNVANIITLIITCNQFVTINTVTEI